MKGVGIRRESSLSPLNATNCSVDTDATHRDTEEIDKIRWRNVHFCIAYVTMHAVFYFMALGNFFDTFVFLISGKQNRWVGYVEGTAGFTALICFLPIGIIVDKFSRALICQVAIFLFLVSGCLGFIAIWMESLEIMLAFMVAVAISQDVCISAVGAICTDSLLPHERMHFFTVRGIFTTLGASAGGLVTWIFFLVYGDEWDLDIVKIPLLTGILCSLPIIGFCLFNIRDVDPKVIDQSNMILARREARDTLLSNECHSETTASDSHLVANDRTQILNDVDARSSKKLRAVPILVVLSSVIIGLGAGMMVKYLPMFYKEDFDFSPAQVGAMGFLSPLMVGLGFALVNEVSGFTGRPIASLIFTLLGTVCLVGMLYSNTTALIVITSLLRTGAQNAPKEVDLSILMDYTKSEHRGKWNAFSGLERIVWSLGAVIGGFIADGNDYRHIFSASIIFYVIGGLVFFPTIPILWNIDNTEHTTTLVEAKKNPEATALPAEIIVN